MLRAFDIGLGRLLVLAAAAGKEPPTEIKLFGKGTTATTKGPVVWDDEARKATAKAFEDSGLDLLPFDVGHGMIFGMTPESHKAFGWFKPDAREDGLYATGIEWTSAGSAALQAREFRFFSPAILLDDESGRVMELINVALTNIPATRGQAPLVASAVVPPTQPKPKEQQNMSVLLQLLAVLAVSEEQAVERVRNLRDLDARLLTATGAPDTESAFARIDELGRTNVALTAKCSNLELEALKVKRCAQCDELTATGRLAPSMREYALTVPESQWEAFERGLPPASPSGQALHRVPGQGPTPPTSPNPTALSSDERAMCLQVGITEEAYLAEKQRVAANPIPCLLPGSN